MYPLFKRFALIKTKIRKEKLVQKRLIMSYLYILPTRLLATKYVTLDWDEILSAVCPVGALPHLVCCVEATMVVDPRIPWEWGRVFLKIQRCYGPPVGCGLVHFFLELIVHGSPRYSWKTSFLKKAEDFLHLWLINPRISHGIIGETGLLEDWL
jgi:hypothetical protein